MDPSSELSKVKIESIRLESKDIFKNLKSNYILKRIFNNLLKGKSLNIIKYNNNIKNRINISFKDYKEYSEIIEIEIKPANNKYGKFININRENINYYHIYFDENKEEIKRNLLNENDKVVKLRIIIDHQINSFEGIFEGCECLEYIYFKKFYRNNINNMGTIFNNCFSLKELNLSNFNTNNVTNMSSMFFCCSSLKELNLSNFNTKNVTDISEMFFGCSGQFQNKIKAQYKAIKEEAFDKNKLKCIIY